MLVVSCSDDSGLQPVDAASPSVDSFSAPPTDDSDAAEVPDTNPPADADRADGEDETDSSSVDADVRFSELDTALGDEGGLDVTLDPVPDRREPDFADTAVPDTADSIDADLDRSGDPEVGDAILIEDGDIELADLPTPDPPLACGLDVVAISLFQSVEVPLMADGSAVMAEHAPIIPEKEAMLRVFLRLQDEWEPRKVRLVVDLHSATNGDSRLESTRSVFFDSEIGNLASTFNVHIPAGQVNSDTSFSIALREAERTASGPGHCDLAIWPSEGSSSLDVEPDSAPIEVVLVPVQYNHDESGRLPDTSPEQLAIYEEMLYATYPVHEVNLSVIDPLSWDGAIETNGVGWNDLLLAITNLRNEHAPAADVYYYGLIVPVELDGEYEGVKGLAYVPYSVDDAALRCALGLGYPGRTSAEVMVHEVAHLHGRRHTDCGSAANVDLNYPYTDGKLGSWGYDIEYKRLIDPEATFDFMGYCEPVWISDYTYAALFDWAMDLSALLDHKAGYGVGERWASMSFVVGQSPRLGPVLPLGRGPCNGDATLSWYGADGTLVNRVVGDFVSFDQLDGGLVRYPMPPANVAWVTGHAGGLVIPPFAP